MSHILTIALNGPPGSGKDYSADVLASKLCYLPLKFAAPLKRAIPAFLDVSHLKLEEVKDTPGANGWIPHERLSYRDLQISLSENWAKSLFGSKIFGTLGAQRVCGMTPPCRIVISDCGFRQELLAYHEYLQAHAGCEVHTLLLRIQREGCDFKTDSRDYVRAVERDGLQEADIFNGGGPTYGDLLNHYAETWEAGL